MAMFVSLGKREQIIAILMLLCTSDVCKSLLENSY